MRVTIHFMLMCLAESAAFFGGALTAFLMLTAPLRTKLGSLAILPVGFGAVSAVLAVRYLMRRYPSRCVKCNGTMYATGTRQVVYCCTQCGHSQQMRIVSNW